MFRAHDPARDQPVAVKLFTLDLPPERVHQLVAEFERLIAAALDHPALSAPLATGMVGVSAYLVYEYIDAQSLDLAVREFGPAPPAHAVRVAAQLAGALDFAAAVNVLHGALHPRDVLLSATDIRLTGVGVGRALEAVGVTPPIRRPYAAPERVAGAPWDRRADVFSLAALVHELVWGRRITGIGSEVATTMTPVGAGNLAMLRATFARALAHDRPDRYATALEYAEALSGAFPEVTSETVPAADEPPASSRRGTGARAPSPPLPLDEDVTIVRGSVAPVASTSLPAVDAREPIAVDAAADISRPPSPADAADLQLKAAEEERYRDVEAAPSIVVPVVGEAPLPLAEPLPASVAAPLQAGGRRSIAWPVAAALAVGVGLGFLVGYGAFSRGSAQNSESAVATQSPPPAAAQAPSLSTPAREPGREFTETAVAPAPPPPTPVQPPRADATGAAVPPDRTTQPAARTEAATSAPGRILVRSTPAGARVVIDGRDYGETPVAVRDLANGSHRVRVMRDGFSPVERRVRLTASRPAQAITVPLQRAPATARAAAPSVPIAAGGVERFVGSLVVDSRPSGAKVYLDGRLVGNTPLAMAEVRAGEHAVRLEHDGYRRWSGSVRVVAAEQNRVTASLER